MKRLKPFMLAAAALMAPALLHAEVGVSLNGSRSSMVRQNRIAKQEEYTFLRTATQVRRFVDNGYLVAMPGNTDYSVIAGFPYARPVVKEFIERLAAGYRHACGERLVVTSLTRPSTNQPSNASPLSVHPAGMAVDLRIPARGSCLSWLSAELLELEDAGLIDATREYRPPHFHVAVFPTPYGAYEQTQVAKADAAEAVRRLEQAAREREWEAFWTIEAPSTEPAHASMAPSLELLVRALVLVTSLVLPV